MAEKETDEEKGLFNREDDGLTETEDDEPNENSSAMGLRDRLSKSKTARNLISGRDKFLRLLPKKCRDKFDSFWIVAFAMLAFVVVIAISLVISIQFTVRDKGAIATDHLQCTKLAERILQRRGSAVDAAITAMLCLGVVGPESSGIGGGGFMTVRDPGGKVTVIEFREVAPANATQDMFQGDNSLRRAGGLTVAVPMELCGISKAYDLFHKLEWPALVDPVVDLACSGFTVSEHLARSLLNVQDYPQVLNSTLFNQTFYRSGRPVQAGEKITNERLGKMLLEFRKSQLSTFYEGDKAKAIIDLIRAEDGVMGLEDLKNACDNVHVYSGDEVPSFKFNNFTAYAPGVPAGGSAMLSMLNILSGYRTNGSSLQSDGYARSVDYQRIVEAMKFTFAGRNHFGDPRVCSTPGCNATILQLQERMLSQAYGDQIRSMINDTHTHLNSSYYGEVFHNVDDHGTTHISVVAPSGQAVSVTTTVNYYFGSLLMTEDGFFLNNQMADFAVNGLTTPPVDPNNLIEPGKRPLSSQSPAIIVKDPVDSKYPAMVTGASGGTHIITATAQAIINKLMFDLDLTASITNKRFHHQLYPDILQIEEGVPSRVVTYLSDAGHNVTMCNATTCSYGVVQGVTVDSASAFAAFSDPRKGPNGGGVVEVLE